MKSYNCDKISPGSILRGSNFSTIWNTRSQYVSRALQSSLCNLYLKNLKLSHKTLWKMLGFIPQESTAASDAISLILPFKIWGWQGIIWWNAPKGGFPDINLNLFLLVCYGLDIKEKKKKKKLPKKSLRNCKQTLLPLNHFSNCSLQSNDFLRQ